MRRRPLAAARECDPAEGSHGPVAPRARKKKYAPLTPHAIGLQSVYLMQIGAGLASVLFALIGNEATSVADVGHEISKIERDSPAPVQDIEEWEQRVETAIILDTAIRETERTALVQGAPRAGYLSG